MDLHRVSRRKFLAAGAAATTCSLLPSTVLGANQMVNMAAIGIGQRGGSITKAFGSNPNVNLDVHITEGNEVHIRIAAECEPRCPL